MPPHRDRAAFERRAAGYEIGWLGHLHHEIAERTATLALDLTGSPKRILDIGCGTGYLLRLLACQSPNTLELVGIDPSAAMIGSAKASSRDPRLQFTVALAEALPYPEGFFDLAVSTTSFDHWSDQQAGLAECARVLTPGAPFVLVDQFSWWLTPTLVAGRRGKARTKDRGKRLLVAAGFQSPEWHNLYAVIIKAAVTTKDQEKP
jgi:ubiquinone/menaquinone biosynthesis C-methylase UbiE